MNDQLQNHLLQNPDAPSPKRILALDGGGIKGAITLGFLKRIEDEVRKRFGDQTRLCDYFDFIGGTSTGSIITTLLATGAEVATIQTLYQSLGQQVFGQKKNWLGRLRATFDERALESLLYEHLQDHTLGSDFLRTGLCIITTRADTSSTWPLINHPGGRFFKDNAGILLRKAVRASTAAPTYFVPEKIDVGAGQIGAFVDGGVSSHNCPALYMFLVATLNGFPFHWATGRDQLLILSIGTGASRKRRPAEKVANSKLWDWAKEAPELFMGDSAKLNQIMLQYLSHNLTPWEIDSEIGNMQHDVLHGKPAFSYVRYNVKLEENDLNKLGFTGLDLDSIREMSNAENVDILSRIGEKAAEIQVKPEHLPAAFNLG